MFNRFKNKNTEKEKEAQHASEDKLERENAENVNPPGEGQGLFTRLIKGLSRTRNGFIDKVTSLFSSYSKINEELFEELEEVLIQADVGVQTALVMTDGLRERVEKENIKDPVELKTIFKEVLINLLQDDKGNLSIKKGLNILMVVGVNGSGKTTTIAKIAQQAKNEEKKVLLAAGDTFRAAAIDQLKIWGDRIGIDVISQQEGADAAAVVFDAIQAARSRDIDLLIADTAGRLHTQKNLMEELKKVRRVIDKESEGANIEVLLVLDATNGQNAMNQAKIFNEAVKVDGIALTKLDGTAKGGIVVAIKNELGIPIKLIGVGEAAEDLQPFHPDKFIEALFEE